MNLEIPAVRYMENYQAAAARLDELVRAYDAFQIEYALVSFNFSENGCDQADRTSELQKAAAMLSKVFGYYGEVIRLTPTQFVVVAADLTESKLKQLQFVFLRMLALEDTQYKQVAFNAVSEIVFSYENPRKSFPGACCPVKYRDSGSSFR